MAITTTAPYEPFTQEYYSAQTPRNIALIESQFSETESTQPQPQQRYPVILQQPYPVYLQQTRNHSSPEPLTVIAIVGILGLFGLLAFLAYMKR